MEITHNAPNQQRMDCLKTLLAIGLLAGMTNLVVRAQPAPPSDIPGVVVAHSPGSSGIYLGSPSICKLLNGDYVASHDLFGPKSTEHQRAISRVYKSTDKGKSWRQIAEINGQFWSKLFVHRNSLYIFGTDKHHGNTIIRKSTDGGVSWTEPTDGSNGLLHRGEYHCAPMPLIEHKGRLWRAMEDAMGPVPGWGKRYGSFMMSIPVEADLMNAANWTSSNVMRYDSTYLGGAFGGWIEGNAVVAPDGNVVNMLRADYRVNGDEKAAIIQISPDGKTASFDRNTGFIDFPGGCKKFSIRYDPTTRRYWTLTNFVPKEFKGSNPERTRNTQALCSSTDLRTWTVHHVILQHPDVSKHGFQYVDWMVEGNDIIAVSRTAWDDETGGAHRQHDANFMTFHRVKDFRKLSRETIASNP